MIRSNRVRTWGLSQRVRGNPPNALRPTPCLRSIPARAGEPSGAGGRCRCFPVYPSACGGTRLTPSGQHPAYGLSPRVRGNLQVPEGVVDAFRSIPARAGEPTRATVRWLRRRVYPRACGGTPSVSHASYGTAGLSPRVRGNRLAGPCGDLPGRSIPARAGEPVGRRQHHLAARVYPRACGGTLAAMSKEMWAQGLSPRVRGNHGAGHPAGHQDGSIPARAGEPFWSTRTLTRPAVYPRACGGTPWPRT